MDIRELLLIINEVTVYHRHKMKIPKQNLDNLCDAQIDFEKHLNITQQPLSNIETSDNGKRCVK